MITAITELLFGTLLNGLTALFWLACWMRWLRISFFVPGGAFVWKMTEWANKRLRPLLPQTRWDLSSILAAWLCQMLLLILKMALLGHFSELPFLGIVGVVLIGGFIETLFVAGYLLFGLTLLAVILSWLQPQAPLAPLIHALVAPFLAPIRRWVPLVGGIDLSPVVLLLALNLLAIIGTEARHLLIRTFLGALLISG